MTDIINTADYRGGLPADYEEKILRLREIAGIALNALRAAGAQDAAVDVSVTETDELNAENNEWTLLRSVSNTAIGLKAIIDKKRGIKKVNSFDEDEIVEACRECVETALSAQPDDAVSIAPFTENRVFAQCALSPDMPRFFDRLDEYLADIRAVSPFINVESVNADYSSWTAVFANTNGVCQVSCGGSYDFGALYSAHDGDKTTSFNSMGVSTADLDTPFIEMGMQRTLLERCVEELDSEPMEGKFTGTVVFDPGTAAEFIGMALGCFASGGSLIDGTSVWKDKLGQKVASDKLTVAFAPLDERIFCGERFTVDGYISEDYDIIRNGVLRQFDLDDYAANKTGFRRAPNTSGAMRVEPGDKSLDEIVAGIKDGILVCRFSGGSPAPNGDFSGVAKNSFIIKDGKIGGAVTETMISGNLADLMLNIREIGSEIVCNGNLIMPYIAADGVTVSG